MNAKTAKSSARRRDTSAIGALGVNEGDEFIQSIEPNPKFDGVLRPAKGAVNRVALYYHASYLEHFGKAPPFGSVPARGRRTNCVNTRRRGS